MSVPASAYGAVSTIPPPAKDPYVEFRGPNFEEAPRCRHCNRRLAEFLTRPYSIRCHSCKQQSVVP